MISKNSLFLYEEIMLISIRDKDGSIADGETCRFAIGGAILAELLLDGRIAVEESRRKLVNLVSPKNLGDPIMDESLQRISSAKRRASIKTWVKRLAGMKKLNHRVAEHLCERGILRADKDKLLYMFPRKTYPKINHQVERKLIERLRKAIFTDTTTLNPRTSVLVSLADNADLLKLVFEKKELKGRKKRIKAIQDGEVIGKATRDAIEAARATAMLVVMMSTS